MNDKQSALVAYLDELENNQKVANDNQKILTDPDIQHNKCISDAEEVQRIAVDKVLARVYKDAVPVNNEILNVTDDEAVYAVQDISKARTGKDSLYYLKEAIKRNSGNKLLKSILEFSEKKYLEYIEEAKKEIGLIDVNSLKPETFIKNSDIEEVSKKLNLDEISEVIKNNVKVSMQDEITRAKSEEEYYKFIEDELAKDDSITNEKALERAIIDKYGFEYVEKRIHQSSLMEAIMLSKSKQFKDNSQMLFESVKEFTKYSLINTLDIEPLDIPKTLEITNSYK